MSGSGRQSIVALASRLFQDRGSDLLRYLRRRVRADADARDIAQEAYLRFIRLAKPDVVENPEAYLFRIASNLVWEHQLRCKSESGPEVADEPVAADVTPFEFAASAQVAQRVRSALEDLSATPRAALVLHLRDGLTCAEIATQMGVSVSMVKKHLSGAVAHCRRRLRDQNL